MLSSRSKLCTLLALSLLTSCKRQTTEPRPTIEFVRTIAAGKNMPEHKMASSYDTASVAGPVCLVGESARCLRLSEFLMVRDTRDNVTGALSQDGLPDFAGEEFLSLLDEANTPYEGFLKASNRAYLRELTVRHVLECLDTVSFISPYDREGMGRKLPAKYVVLVSPYMAACGRFDADTLFTCLGKSSPVLSAVDLLFDRAFAEGKGSPVNVALVADSIALNSGVYDEVFEEKMREHSARGSKLFRAPRVTGTGNFLLAFLDAYEATGETEPLSALLVDEYTADVDSMRATLSRIRVELSDESLRYGKMITPDFKILESRQCVADECYRLMRLRNNFTHKIAYPKADALVCAPRTDLPVESYGADGAFAPDFKYSRIPCSEVPTCMLLQYGNRYLPASVMEILRAEAPKTYLSYVQK